MKKLFVLFVFLACTVTFKHPLAAQDSASWTPKDRNLQVEMLFPGGKTNTLILSYDDGSVEDRKLVALLNQYKLKGTFHLNSGKLAAKGIISADEIKTLYAGHEVSHNGFNHLGMKGLSKIDLFYEVGEDRRLLEKHSGGLVRGLAYPFGS